MSGWANFQRQKSHTLRNKLKYRFQSCSRAFGYLRNHIIPNEIAYIIIWNSNVTACKVRLVWRWGTTSISRLPVSLITISMIVQASLEPKDLLKGLQQQPVGWWQKIKKKGLTLVNYSQQKKKELIWRNLMETCIDPIIGSELCLSSQGTIIADFCQQVTWLSSHPNVSGNESPRVNASQTHHAGRKAARRTAFLLLLMFPFQNNGSVWMTFFGKSYHFLGKTFFKGHKKWITGTVQTY